MTNNKETDTIQVVLSLAGDFCTLLENSINFSKKDFIFKLQHILPLLYSELIRLERPDISNEEINEKYVTEEIWSELHLTLQSKLGQHNNYLETFDPSMDEQEGPITKSIAEDITDIYQDIKDFHILYGVGNLDVMHQALWDIIDNFENYWGQKLVNVLRAIHNLCYGDEDLSDEENNAPDNEQDFTKLDTSSFLISRKMNQYKDNDDDESV